MSSAASASGASSAVAAASTASDSGAASASASAGSAFASGASAASAFASAAFALPFGALGAGASVASAGSTPRAASGVLGTVELGNTVPCPGSDSEWKIAGRDAILVYYHDDTMRLTTAAGEERFSVPPDEPLYPRAVRDIVDHWRRGEPPPVSVHDCLRVVRLIDQAYERAPKEER